MCSMMPWAGTTALWRTELWTAQLYFIFSLPLLSTSLSLKASSTDFITWNSTSLSTEALKFYELMGGKQRAPQESFCPFRDGRTQLLVSPQQPRGLCSAIELHFSFAHSSIYWPTDTSFCWLYPKLIGAAVGVVSNPQCCPQDKKPAENCQAIYVGSGWCSSQVHCKPTLQVFLRHINFFLLNFDPLFSLSFFSFHFFYKQVTLNRSVCPILVNISQQGRCVGYQDGEQLWKEVF